MVEERAQHPEIDFESTLADMRERDRRDSTRADSPLKPADDAIIIDSTGLSINQVFEEMMGQVRRKRGNAVTRGRGAVGGGGRGVRSNELARVLIQTTTPAGLPGWGPRIRAGLMSR